MYRCMDNKRTHSMYNKRTHSMYNKRTAIREHILCTIREHILCTGAWTLTARAFGGQNGPFLWTCTRYNFIFIFFDCASFRGTEWPLPLDLYQVQVMFFHFFLTARDFGGQNDPSLWACTRYKFYFILFILYFILFDLFLVLPMNLYQVKVLFDLNSIKKKTLVFGLNYVSLSVHHV